MLSRSRRGFGVSEAPPKGSGNTLLPEPEGRAFDAENRKASEGKKPN